MNFMSVKKETLRKYRFTYMESNFNNQMASATIIVLSFLSVVLLLTLIVFIVLYVKKPCPECPGAECDTNTLCTQEVCQALFPTSPTACKILSVVDTPIINRALRTLNGTYLSTDLARPYFAPDILWTHQNSKLYTLINGVQYGLRYVGTYPSGYVQLYPLEGLSFEDWIYDGWNIYLKGPNGNYEFGKSDYALLLTPIVTEGTTGNLLTLTPVNLCELGRKTSERVITPA